jgi:hypothetical protein
MGSTNEQVGGSHYKDMPIQPIEFIVANDIPYREANVIKYIVRWRNKNGLEDLMKARHYIDMLIDNEVVSDETSRVLKTNRASRNPSDIANQLSSGYVEHDKLGRVHSGDADSSL